MVRCKRSQWTDQLSWSGKDEKAIKNSQKRFFNVYRIRFLVISGWSSFDFANVAAFKHDHKHEENDGLQSFYGKYTVRFTRYVSSSRSDPNSIG